MARLGRLILICIAAASAACATTGAAPAPFPRPSAPGPRPAAPTPAPAPAPTGSTPKPAPSGRTSNTSSPAATSAIGYGVAGTALSLRGAPYRNGGNDPAGFDCSGFVKYVFNQNGVAVPRTVSGQFHAGRHVNSPQLEPGDLVFFSTVSPGASHVGIAIGGDEFVHAPSRSGEVRVERMSASYWSTRFVGARRVL
jgi:cell wall-associated NlpC family hydrolase